MGDSVTCEGVQYWGRDLLYFMEAPAALHTRATTHPPPLLWCFLETIPKPFDFTFVYLLFVQWFAR